MRLSNILLNHTKGAEDYQGNNLKKTKEKIKSA